MPQLSMSSKALSSDASRPQSGVPVHSSDSHLSSNDGFGGKSHDKKRKYNAYAMEELLKPPIVVKPHPPKLSVKPRSLQPLMLVPREHLPLSCLQLASPQGDLEYSRFYESNVKILDLESRMGSRPVILIARLESDKTVYALEREHSGLYTLCHLGSWVDLQQLSSHATVAYSKLINPHPYGDRDSAIPQLTITPQLNKEGKKRRLAIEAIQSLVKRPSRPRSVSAPSQEVEIVQGSPPLGSNKTIQPAAVSVLQNSPEASQHPTPAASPVLHNDPDAQQEEEQQTAKGICANIRSHYVDALYHSRESLAYFAKGPLSRARAAFHLDCDGNLEMNDLINFLKSLVMTTMQIDKKYRETIPNIVGKMAKHILESGDEDAQETRKKKAKKMKLGKDGLYPREIEHVRKWWSVHKPQPTDEESMTTAMPQETRLQISCLRSRETQLQMILILEILALESLGGAEDSRDSQLPGLHEDQAAKDNTKVPPTKKRNKHNLPMLLDVHADRLSIWQSTSLDDIKMLDDTQAAQNSDAQSAEKSTSDPLRDFCVDIIVPFFSSRLPEQCDSLSRKLGGPVMPSPPKSKPKKAEAATKSRHKPGAISKNHPHHKSSRTLERVLSKDSERHRRSMSRGPGGMIAWMRSASTVPVLKREASEPASLMDLPKRGHLDGLSNKSFDSSAPRAAKRRTEEEKAQKEARVKAQLQDAISSLRKPNREVIGKALAEDAERRAITSLSHLRKSRKPTQHRSPSIVKATPVGGKFRDALSYEARSQPTLILPRRGGSAEVDYVPTSSLIPSSAPRKRNREDVDMEDSPSLPHVRGPTDLVGATPVRPTPLRRNSAADSARDEAVVLVSPTVSRKFLAVPSSTLKHRDSGIGISSSPADRALAETPIKKLHLSHATHISRAGSLESFVTVTPGKKRALDKDVSAFPGSAPEEAVPRKQVSIYEKLGWDDDFDELA